MFQQRDGQATGVFAGLLPVLEAAAGLKGLRRAGWVRVGIPDPESVADHSFRLALMAMLFGPRLGLNVDKMIRLALIHDLAEARIGDLTPADRVTSQEKRERERVAFGQIIDGLPEGTSLDDLWREYEAEASPEARIVRQLDKLEMALQALEYERQYGQGLEKARTRGRQRGARVGPGRVSGEGWADQFWSSARAALTEPLLIAFYDEICALRPRGQDGGKGSDGGATS